MRILVCGDRRWSDRDYLYDILDFYLARKDNPVAVIIEGDATGADQMAGDWAAEVGVFLEVYPAHWERFGHAAGPIRNKEMLEQGKPDLVLAFHNEIHKSTGTKNMMHLAEKAGIKVVLHAPDALIQQKDFGFEDDLSQPRPS